VRWDEGEGEEGWLKKVRSLSAGFWVSGFSSYIAPGAQLSQNHASSPMRPWLSDHLPYRSPRCCAIPTSCQTLSSLSGYLPICKNTFMPRCPSPKPMRCYAQAPDEPSITLAMYLYSPSVALEVLCRITRSTTILWQGHFPSSKRAIFWCVGHPAVVEWDRAPSLLPSSELLIPEAAASVNSFNSRHTAINT
jgi:hypothetical protein